MAYGIKYRLDFCDRYDIKKRIDILQRNYVGGITPFSGSDNPISIIYDNTDSDKFFQITSSKCTVRITASESIDLETFYGEDERQWQIKHYSGSDYALAATWFVIPDNANEPFLAYPYNFELQGADMLNTLKDVPYTDDSALIHKVDNLKNILLECLAKTDLGMAAMISANTYEERMFSSADTDCPLEQTYVNTNRFIDSNSKPYSCYEVIKSICNQFTANIKQWNGVWNFIDQSQKSLPSFLGRTYTAAGVKTGAVTIVNTAMVVNKNEFANQDHYIEKVPAYKIVTNYYQYGYLSNKLINGDFDQLNAPGNPNPFVGWTSTGGLAVGVGQKKVTDGDGERFINDFYAIITNSNQANPARFLMSDPVNVLKTQKVGVSMTANCPTLPSENPSATHAQFTFVLFIQATGGETTYWNGSSWNQGFTTIGVDVDLDSLRRGATVSLNTTYPPFEGALRLYISGAQVRPSFVPLEIFFDSVQVNFDESEYYKAPIGYVDQLTNFYNYSKSPDAVTLLFGDDENDNRTSYMRLSDGSNTIQWRKKGDTGDYRILQSILNRNILSQYCRPSRRFEGTFMGDFTPLDTLSIELLGASFMFLSGTFDVKSGQAKLTLAEVFPGDYGDFSESAFQDYGDFKDSNGNTVGSPSGISIPPVSGNIDSDTFIRNQTALQTGAKFNVTGGTFDDYMTTPLHAPSTRAAGMLWTGDGATAGTPVGGGSLATLSDVLLTSLIVGQSIVWNGSKWVNQNVAVDLSNYWTKSESNARFLGLHATADNSVLHDGWARNFGGYSTSIAGIMGIDGVTANYNYYNASTIQTFLGLGASAFTAETLQSVRNRGIEIYSNANGNTSYTEAAFQVREANGGSTASYTPPRFALHWGGVVASQISIEASGRVSILNAPGTGYENFIANTVYGNSGVLGGFIYSATYVQGDRAVFGYDSNISGSVNASNWFRSSGATGWVNETYLGGIYMADSSFVRVYGGKSFLCEATIISNRIRAYYDFVLPVTYPTDRIVGSMWIA